VFEVDGVRIGILGLTAGDLRRLTAKQATEGCEIEAPLETAKRLVPELRKEADMIILLTHVGIENDVAIAGAVEGIHLIVGGHSHTRLDKHLTSPTGTRVVQAWEFGKAVGVIDLTWDPAERKITEFASKLIFTSDPALPRDAAVQKLVDGWQAKADEIVGVKIGVTDQALSKKELRPRIERLYRDALGCDAGFQNTGGIRDVVRKGDIMIRDVWNVLPFDNTMVKVKIPGARLPEWAKRQIGGTIDEKRIYTIATNSYCTDHMKDNLGADDYDVEDTGLLMRDVAVKWVRDHGGFDPDGKPLPGSEKPASETK
jgi:2',3'-cyclic-nucleotide 2'-phosphodiesterase (5'-nucleotidase family)